MIPRLLESLQVDVERRGPRHHGPDVLHERVPADRSWDQED
jgi:hypothetical protein